MWRWQMDPDGLVLVQQLLFGTGSSVEHVGKIEYVACAIRAEHGVTGGQVDRMAQDLGCKDVRLGRDPSDVAGPPTKEPPNGVIDKAPSRFGNVQQRVELRIEAVRRSGSRNPSTITTPLDSTTPR